MFDIHSLEGTCRHVAAVLFDLEHTARVNDLKSCTSGECQWIKRAKPNANCCLLQNLKLTKLEYGKQEKTCPTVENFEPRTRNPDPSTLCRKLRDGLQNVCSSAVALHVLPQPEIPNVSEEILQSFISADEHVDCVEEVEGVEIFTVSEIRDRFVSECGPIESADAEKVSQFFEEIAVTQKEADMICEKTKNQGQTDFWSKQRTGRLTGSNFYRICHLRENTNKDNILKELLNYHPLPPEKQPEQFRWGHEKENSALDLYLKKLQKKHKGLVICKGGLVVNVSWPHLGASPDGIRHCLCFAKRVIEVKSLFSKRSLPPHIAASEYVHKVNGKYHLKRETKWYYQIQGELATTGLLMADLIIYTNKGIMIVEVEFNRDFWEAMLKKLTTFYKDYLVPELLTQKI